MLTFPNCKINLGLNIVRKRSDGFHDLETAFYPLPFRDALEIIHDHGHSNEPVTGTMSGLPIEGNLNDNLCIKAYYLVKRDHPDLPPVRMHLHKAIAMGAGLGGGSSDGAFTLALLNSTFRLQIPIEKQLDYALQLGSDCPFFIINKPCIATGRGELLQRIQLDLSNYTYVLVLPGIHINTAWAFSQITPKVPAYSIREIIAQPIDSWRLTLVNDFEEAVCHHHPALKKVKDQLYEAGAVYASMTGSGSGFYGIFHSGNMDLTALQPFKYYIVKG